MVALGSLILMGAVPGWSVPYTGGWISPYSVGMFTLWGGGADAGDGLGLSARRPQHMD
jgi:CDP-diacylglycerol--glycerol-3-phosphate 3-phosphatidyltransferase/cardiolipin synthase